MFRISRDAQKRMARAHKASAVAQSIRPLAAKVACDEEHGRVLVFGARGQPAQLVLNDDNQLELAVTPLGRTTRFTYHEGKLASICSPTGLVTSFAYDAGGRLTAVANALGRQEFRYNDADLLVQYRAGSRTLGMSWNAENRLTSFRDGCGRQTSRSYDADGDLVEVRDARHLRTRMEYGSWQEPDRITYPDLAEESFCWRFRSFSRDVDGKRHADVELDEAGRLVLVEYADGRVLSFAYEAYGIVEGASPEAKVSFSYDERARVIAETTDERRVCFEYSPDHQLAAMRWPDGSAVRFEYDPDGRVTKVRDWNGGVQTFGYGAHERPLLRTLPSGIVEANEPDPVGQIRATGAAREEGCWLWYERYERDGDQRVSRRTDTRHGERNIRYDAEGRVLSVSGNAFTQDEEYTYDANGNRIFGGGVDVQVDLRNRPIRAGDRQYTYCPRGNRIEDISPRGAVRYTYNDQDLLTKVELPDGPVEYAYDAFARRVRKNTADGTTTFVWAGHHLIQEIHDSSAGRSTREYVYWPGTHTPLAMRCNGEVYFYHCDHLGTPQLMTDGSGRVVWSVRYDAFGRAEVEIEEVENPLRFAGQYHDLETGLYYNRARYYDPALGCYLSADPASPAGGTDAYHYVGNNPVNLIDPLGLWGEDWPGWVKTTAAVTGAIAVGAGIGTLAVLAVPALGIAAAGSALAMGIGVVAGGIAAGMTGSAIQAYLSDGCVPCALASGAVGGLLGSLPFLFALPGMALAGAGILAALGFVSLGAAGGALAYIGDWYASQFTREPQPWSLEALCYATGLGLATAGVARWAGPRLAKVRSTRAQAKGAPPPSGPFDAPPDLEVNPDAVYGYSPRRDSSLAKLGRFDNPSAVAKNRQDRIAYRRDLQDKRQYARALKKKGASDEQIARTLNDKRNADRAATYSDVEREKLYERNLREYGRKEGPSYEMLREGYTKPNGQKVRGKSDNQIIATATRDNRSANVLLGLDEPGPQPVLGGAGAGGPTSLSDHEEK